jgi:predicted phosphate transport protein (TIGR00153 family)
MRNLFSDFFSHKALFYGLFNKAGKNMADMAALLVEVVNKENSNEREALFKQINLLEETGDDITHKIYLSLDKIYFTPFNRKDIHTLAATIDDVADYIQESAGRINMYLLEDIIPPIREMAQLVLESCLELKKLIMALGQKENMETMLLSCKQVKKYESQTDKIYYRALADLFANQKDAIELIKYRDVLHSLESSANKCKNVTDAIEIILINSI